MDLTKIDAAINYLSEQIVAGKIIDGETIKALAELITARAKIELF